jgi:hypothetical protein
MRKLVSSGSPFEPTVGFSRAVRAGPTVTVAGTAPLGPNGRTWAMPRRRRDAALKSLRPLWRLLNLRTWTSSNGGLNPASLKAGTAGSCVGVADSVG